MILRTQLSTPTVLSPLASGIALVNLVRRKEQVELLQNLGAKYIVNTSDPDWKSALGKLI